MSNTNLILRCRWITWAWFSICSMGYSETSPPFSISSAPALLALSLACCSLRSFKMFFTLVSLSCSDWKMYLGSELSRFEFIIAWLNVGFSLLLLGTIEIGELGELLVAPQVVKLFSRDGDDDDWNSCCSRSLLLPLLLVGRYFLRSSFR